MRIRFLWCVRACVRVCACVLATLLLYIYKDVNIIPTQAAAEAEAESEPAGPDAAAGEGVERALEGIARRLDKIG